MRHADVTHQQIRIPLAKDLNRLGDRLAASHFTATTCQDGAYQIASISLVIHNQNSESVE